MYVCMYVCKGLFTLSAEPLINESLNQIVFGIVYDYYGWKLNRETSKKVAGRYPVLVRHRVGRVCILHDLDILAQNRTGRTFRTRFVVYLTPTAAEPMDRKKKMMRMMMMMMNVYY